MNLNPKNTLGKYTKWTFLAILCGILSGIAAAVFLFFLDWATKTRESYPIIIWFLPLAGLFIGLIYHHFGKDVASGHNLILDEIHDPKKTVPLKMAPFILFGTIITHLFGGSAGREGTAVQMGSSLSDQLSRYFKIELDERKILLVAGAGAGFGAALGTPWAGVIFGMEVINIGKLKLFAWFECLLASFVAYYVAILLKAPHSTYPSIEIPDYSFKIFAFVAIAGVFFGLTSLFFTSLTHFVEKAFSKTVSYSPLKPFIAGLILVTLYYLEGSYRYDGLGIEYIQEALTKPISFNESIFKTLFTSLTVGSGFKGGEFIPLVYIGTTMGNALAVILPISFKLLAAVGFAAVFAGASNTPIACSIMAVEIFGISIAPYALIGCFMSYYFSGHSGIYKSQRVYIKKHKKLLSLLRWLGELPRRFLNGNASGGN